MRLSTPPTAPNPPIFRPFCRATTCRSSGSASSWRPVRWCGSSPALWRGGSPTGSRRGASFSVPPRGCRPSLARPISAPMACCRCVVVCLAHSCVTAPLAPLADALAVPSSIGPRGFRYGWVRGAGSLAFVGGTLLSGQLVDRFGLSCIIVASSILFLAMAPCSALVEAPRVHASGASASRGAFRALLAIPAYRWLLVVTGLVIGSHALNDAYAVITWRAAGYGGTVVSLLWSESVLAEVVVFFLIGPWLIDRLGPAGAAGLSAAAGVLRWTVMGTTSALPALVAVQGLHGFTFALLHLAAMRVIGDRGAGSAFGHGSIGLWQPRARNRLGGADLRVRLSLCRFRPQGFLGHGGFVRLGILRRPRAQGRAAEFRCRRHCGRGVGNGVTSRPGRCRTRAQLKTARRNAAASTLAIGKEDIMNIIETLDAEEVQRVSAGTRHSRIPARRHRRGQRQGQGRRAHPRPGL